MSSADNTPQALRVLLLTPDIIARQLASGLLKMKGHQVTVAASVAEGLAEAKAAAADVILIDAKLTRDLAQLVEQLKQLTEAPVATIGGLPDDRVRQALSVLGCNTFLASPIQPPDLYAALERMSGGGSRAEPQVTICLDTARDTLSGGPDELRELIEIMLSETPRFLEGIEEGLATAEEDEIERQAHSLKGAARVFGAEEVVEFASQLEQSAHDGQLEQVREQLPQLTRLVEALLAELTKVAGRL